MVSAFLLSLVWGRLGMHTRGMLLAAYGVIILGFGLIPELRYRAQLKRGAQTRGTVVDAERVSGRRTITYHPVVRFTTADGRPVTFTADVGFGHRPKIGRAVPVRYRRDDPAQAEIDRAYTWMLPVAAWLLVGVGLLVAAVVVVSDEPQLPAALRAI